MMRVVLVIDKMDVGGAPRHVMRLALGLKLRGVCVSVVCLSHKGKYGEQLEASGVAVCELGIKKIYSWFGLVGVSEVAECLKGADVVQTFLFSSNILGVVAARAVGVKRVIASWRDCGFALRWYHNIALRYYHKKCDVITANSNSVADAIKRHTAIGGKKVVLIRNGVELKPSCDAKERRAQARDVLGVRDDCFVVGCVGRLDEVKDHKTLILAAGLLTSENIEFHLIGNGYLLDELKLLAKEQKARVVFHTDCKNGDELVEGFDVAVNVSTSEGLSNALIEALGAGVAIIATKISGNVEVVGEGEESAGMFIDVADFKALSEKILELRRNDELRNRLCGESRNRAEEFFVLDRMIDEHCSLYEKC